MASTTSTNPEKRGPGRPRKHTERLRTSIEVSVDDLNYIKRVTGKAFTRNEWINQAIKEKRERDEQREEWIESVIADRTEEDNG